MPEGVLDANRHWRPREASLPNQHQYADALDLSRGILEHHTVDPDAWVGKARSVLGLSRPEEVLAAANYTPTRDIDTVQGYSVLATGCSTWNATTRRSPASTGHSNRVHSYQCWSWTRARAQQRKREGAWRVSYANGNIRHAITEDQAAIEACVRAAYSIYIERIGKKPAPILADYQALIARGVVYVLVDEANLCGVLVMMQQGESMFVENIAVDPRFQRHGLGHALMMFVEEQARMEHLSAIRLYTHELMTENLAFYRKLGFEEEARHEQDGYCRVLLRKRLA